MFHHGRLSKSWVKVKAVLKLFRPYKYFYMAQLLNMGDSSLLLCLLDDADSRRPKATMHELAPLQNILSSLAFLGITFLNIREVSAIFLIPEALSSLGSTQMWLL